MKNCDGHVKGGNRGLYSPLVTLSLPLVFSIHHENLRPSNGPSRLRRRSNATKPIESTCASLFFHGEICLLLCLLLVCMKCGVRLPPPVGHDKLQIGFPLSDMLPSFALAIPPQRGLPYCYSGDTLPSPDMTNSNVQRGECSFSVHRSASPTRGEVCSLFSFVHNEFASASPPHHTYHIHNSVPSVFGSSPFEVTVGSAYHEAWGTHTHKRGTLCLFVTKVYALHTIHVHSSGRRPLPCHNISRDMDRTEDPGHLSPTKGTDASLITGEVCSPPVPIQRSSARAQDTNLLRSLGVDSWTSVSMHSSAAHPSPYHLVPSDEEQRDKCSSSEHRSASPTHGEVCSLFSFVHNEFASASLPHHTYHIHNSVPSVFSSSPFEVMVGSAYHEAWGTHTHKHNFSFRGPHSSVLPRSARPDLRAFSWPPCHIYAAGWIHRYPVSYARRVSTGMRRGNDGPQGRSAPIRIPGVSPTIRYLAHALSCSVCLLPPETDPSRRHEG